MEFEEQSDGEVVEEAAVQDDRDEGGQPALARGSGGFSPDSIHLTQDWGHPERKYTENVFISDH